MSESPPEGGGPRRGVPRGLVLLLLLAVGILYFAGPRLFRGGSPARSRSEHGGLRALEDLGAAQALYREADKDKDGRLDYATLRELGEAGLIDAALASGTQSGYRFESTYGALTPEFLWFATASPTGGDGSEFHYATSHEGMIFYSTAPIAMNSADCTMPTGARRLRR